jgi:hypothetical protein
MLQERLSREVVLDKPSQLECSHVLFHREPTTTFNPLTQPKALLELVESKFDKIGLIIRI